MLALIHIVLIHHTCSNLHTIEQAEDARLLEKMGMMRQHYSDLFTLNRALVGEYVKRANNHAALLAALRQVPLYEHCMQC
jgi:hypothetical protein